MINKSHFQTKIYFFLLIFTMLVIYFDSNLLSLMGGELNLRLSYLEYKILFIISCIVFIFTDIYFLRKIKDTLSTISYHSNKNRKIINKLTFRQRYNILLLSQLIMIGLLSFLLIDITIFNKYFVFEILLIITCSYITGFSFLLFTSFKFIKWFRQKKNLLFILYIIFFLLFSFNLVTSFVLISFEVLNYSFLKKKREIPISLFFSGIIWRKN